MATAAAGTSQVQDAEARVNQEECAASIPYQRSWKRGQPIAGSSGRGQCAPDGLFVEADLADESFGDTAGTGLLDVERQRDAGDSETLLPLPVEIAVIRLEQVEVRRKTDGTITR
jgi:hypothetical protein